MIDWERDPLLRFFFTLVQHLDILGILISDLGWSQSHLSHDVVKLFLKVAQLQHRIVLLVIIGQLEQLSVLFLLLSLFSLLSDSGFLLLTLILLGTIPNGTLLCKPSNNTG